MGIVGISSLGHLLLKTKLITEEQLLEALRVQKQEGRRLSSVLLKLGYINEESLITVLSKQYDVPPVNLGEIQIDASLLKIIPYEKSKRYLLIPFAWNGDSLKVAIADPSNSFALDDVKFLSGKKLSVYVAAESAILGTLERLHPEKDVNDESLKQKRGDGKDVMETDDLNKVIGMALDDVTTVEDRDDEGIKEIDAPLIKLVNNVLLNAIQSRASDIHIEPYEDVLLVRYRIDGVLQPFIKLPVKIKSAVISRIKIMSHLDISERRLPQDGRIKLKLGNKRQIDLRVSTLPTLFGEKVVMRLLDKSNLQLDLAKLGFEKQPLDDFMEAIEKPYGMILVTGPTGSGKTTTLYSALAHLNDPGVNIMTAEDPVEYNFMGINQVQIREEIGLTFASALRSFLRQDPDIIMVGEIRDFETAEIAVKAALTGHLVLSTLHTNDAPSTMTRLINMGVEPFLVSASVILIVAQRLVRKICQHCKHEQQFSESALLKIGFSADQIKQVKCFSSKGCPACNNTGFRGRMALYEIMPVKDEIKELILQGASAVEIKREAVRLGMMTLRQSGIRKIIEGVTSVDEVLRVTFED